MSSPRLAPHSPDRAARTLGSVPGPASRLASLGPVGVAGAVLVLAVWLTGCASSAPASGPASETAAPPEPSSSPTERTAADLRRTAERWEGVPHEWGGTSRRGVDCSGLVQNLYRDVFGMQVPRTTAAQAETGRRVRRDDLRPGDLVFFRLGRKKRHVGVYLSDGEFAHASASSGVTVSPLDRAYWNERWWQARRLAAGPAASPPATSEPSDKRAGW